MNEGPVLQRGHVLAGTTSVSEVARNPWYAVVMACYSGLGVQHLIYILLMNLKI